MASRLSKHAALGLLLLAGVTLVVPTPAHAREVTLPTAPRLLADDEYYPALLAGVREAQVSIDLAMYLWKMTKSPKNLPRQLIQALGQAHQRGVRVRVLLENSGYDQEINRANQETALLLKQEGIKVIFDSPTVTTHVKLAIIDGRFTFLGSHNLTQSALGRNHELSLRLDDRELAARLTAYLDKLAAP